MLGYQSITGPQTQQITKIATMNYFPLLSIVMLLEMGDMAKWANNPKGEYTVVLSWEMWLSACRPDPPKDRDLLSTPTCCQHVSQHVSNTVPKCVATGANMTR